MNIYTSTFYLNNYGSVLQAYALQSKLKELGADPYIILPQSEPANSKCSFFTKLRNFLSPEKHYGIIRKVKRYMQRKILAEKLRKINGFASRNLNFISYNDILNCMKKPCCMLAGSDQIWNIIDRPINSLYLFGFVKNENIKKYSYAASIGLQNLDDEQKRYYKRVLSDFSVVSFREKAAKELLGGMLENNVRDDIDPTLLWDEFFWEKIVSERQHNGRYIFIYMLRPDRKLIKIARKLSRVTGFDIIFTGQFCDKYTNIKTVSDAGPEEFLSYIKNAQIVVTNSFHGTVFSVLFGKKFVSVKIQSTGSRAENLLTMLHLEDHLISKSSDWKIALDNINYSDVNKKLNSERKKSEEYLKSIVEGN